MNFNQITKTFIAIAFIAMVAGIAVAQDVETQENVTENLDTQVENQTELPEHEDIRLPGDRFYGITQASERIELEISRAPVIGSEDRKARALANHADRRVAEIEGLVKRNDTERTEQALDRYSQGIEQASQAANSSGNEEALQNVDESAARHQETLQIVSEQLPEQAQEGIKTAMENSQRTSQALGDSEGTVPDLSEDVESETSRDEQNLTEEDVAQGKANESYQENYGEEQSEYSEDMNGGQSNESEYAGNAGGQ